MLLAFGDCELDEQLYQLRRGGRAVRIEPKVFDVLLHLLRNRERVVSKIELLDAIWPGEAVSESVLPRCIAAARRAIGDDRTRQALIQTVHGRGYRFVAPLTVSERSAAHAAPPPEDEAPALFVGRAGAMERLDAALEDVQRARGRLALIVGEPGIGKTRTAEELAARARRRGARVLLGRCYEGEGAPAYWPWVQVLRACVADLDAESLAKDMGPGAADLAQLLPELRQRLPDLPPSETTLGDQARFRLFDSVSRFLERLCLREPLVIVLDDLHWADADSLLLVQFMAGALRNRRVLLAATYRDVEVRRTHPLGALLGGLAREPHCERVLLRGLTRDEVASLIEGIAGEAPSQDLTAAIHDMTEGNPFFVRELVRLVCEGGALGRGDPRALALALPQSVRDAVGRRLDALSEACNELLRVAAVLGREFGTGVLARVTGQAGEALLEPLSEALAAQVLVESESGHSRYAFAHALTRHTLYEELSVPARVQLHRRIAEALEAAGGEAPGDLLAELAHHFFEAAPGGDARKAVEYSLRAARRAHELFAYDESVRHYERALEALDLELPVDDRRRCQLLLSLAEETWAAGERDRSRETFSRAAEIARRLADTALLARAAVGLRGYGEMGVAPDAETLALLEESLAALGDDQPAWRSRVLSRMASTTPWSSRMAERERLSREASALALASGDREAISDALAARYWATLGPDRLEERKQMGREAIARGVEWGDPRLRILGHEALIGAQLLEGEMSEARREIDLYADLAEAMRQPLFLCLAELLRGSFAVNTGGFEEAERRFDAALAIGRGTVAYAEALHAGSLYWVRTIRGDAPSFTEVEPVLREIYTEGASNVRALIRTGAAMAHLARDELAAARHEYEALRKAGFASLERDESWMLCMGVLADLALEVEDAEGASQIYALLAPYEGLTLSQDLLRVFAGTVWSARGVAALACGALDAGEAHFERAIAWEREQGMLPALINSQAGLARLLLARGGRGDRTRARGLLDAAEAGAGAVASRRAFRQIRRARALLEQKPK